MNRLAAMKRILAGAALAAYLCLGALGADGLVLCVSPGSHVAIEEAGHGARRHAVPARTPEWAPGSCAKDCDPCVDIPLPGRGECRAPSPAGNPERHGPQTHHAGPPMSPAPSCAPRAAPLPTAAAPPLLALRTVILRT